ncbi:protease inhibitor [Fonsecaea pedrosoi]|nr:protease inhibitor [Fonsecaea pedrosoi]
MPDHQIFKTVVALVEKDGSKPLQLAFGSRVVKPGDKIPKGEAQGLPTLGWDTAGPDQKFVVLSLDLDAPFPSFAPLSPILHWLQTGLVIGGSSSADGVAPAAAGQLTSPDPAVAFWAGPGPPPISSPHRYVFLLYAQPPDFDARTFTKAGGFGIRDRMRWDPSRFEKRAKLGTPVAATYFLSN